jgi:hypothetical protein
MSIILRVDGLLGNMNGTVYGEQVNGTIDSPFTHEAAFDFFAK